LPPCSRQTGPGLAPILDRAGHDSLTADADRHFPRPLSRGSRACARVLLAKRLYSVHCRAHEGDNLPIDALAGHRAGHRGRLAKPAAHTRRRTPGQCHNRLHPGLCEIGQPCFRPDQGCGLCRVWHRLAPAREYEIDHLISLELGGSNDIKNLWPESCRTEPWNARAKDKLENRLHELVCTGQILVEDAQRAIAQDWIAAYQHFVGAEASR
jgi:hypothetical protein